MVANTDIYHCAKPAPQSLSPSLPHTLTIATTPTSAVAATSISYNCSSKMSGDGVGCGGGDGGGGGSGGSRRVVVVVVVGV